MTFSQEYAPLGASFSPLVLYCTHCSPGVWPGPASLVTTLRSCLVETSMILPASGVDWETTRGRTLGGLVWFTGDRRQEVGDRRHATGGRMQEVADLLLDWLEIHQRGG